MRFEDICAVVVTYRYPHAELAQLLELLQPQVGRVVVVDNNPPPEAPGLAELRQRHAACDFIVNGANLGLAKALNQGIRSALAAGFRWMLLFDQDSRLPPAMLQRLVAARDELGVDGGPVAAFGPTISDDRMRRPLPFIRFSNGRMEKLYPAGRSGERIETDMLITSGCLIDGRVIEAIGAMDERLFIDNIDMEWCFRARAAGFRLIGVADAVLDHRIGDRVRPVPGTRRNILVHSPLRQYYIMRNRILLYRRDYVPRAWKRSDLPRLLFKLIYFPLMVAPRLENLKMMLKGIRDGLLDR